MDELDLGFLNDLEFFSDLESPESASSQGTTSIYFAASDLLTDVASDFPDLHTLTDSLFPETQTTSSLDQNNNNAIYQPMELLHTSWSTENTLLSGGSYNQQQQPMNIADYNPNLYDNHNSVSYAQVAAIPANPYWMSDCTMVTPMNHLDTQQSSQLPQSVNHSMAMGPNLHDTAVEYPSLPTNTNAQGHYDTQCFTSIGSTGSPLYPDPSMTTTTSVNWNLPGASMTTPATSAAVSAVGVKANGAKKKLTPYEKLKLKRERNRLASKKCRQKKFDNIARYEKRLGELQQDTDTLEKEIKAMREKSTRLKQIYLENYSDLAPVRISRAMAGKDNGSVYVEK